MSTLSNIINFIKDTISPKVCYSCKIEWHFLCLQCLQKINKYSSFCYVCKLNSDNFEIHKKCKKYVFFDKIIVYTHYKNNTIKKLIKDAKYYGRQEVLYDFWLQLSTMFLENENISIKTDYIIIPSPMHFLRKLSRWYNQSEILAKTIALKTGINYNKYVLKKIKNTKQQSKLQKHERDNNLKDCFKVNKKYIEDVKGKNIILVDDVISTWATINEISKVLKEAWVKKVIWLIIASD